MMRPVMDMLRLEKKNLGSGREGEEEELGEEVLEVASTARRWQMRAPRSWPARITCRGGNEGDDDDDDLVSNTWARASSRAWSTARFVWLPVLAEMGVLMP